VKGRLLRHPAPWAILALVIAEAAIAPSFRRALPDRLDDRRNPFARRNWDEYARWTGRPRGRERRVLLLGNSQARGPEVPADRIYAAQLQQRLNQGSTGAPVRVVNWSFGPDRVPEAILLLARARDLDPDVVLAVFPPTWFADEDYEVGGRPTPLSMFPSDLVDTAWLYRDRVPPEFATHYLRPVRAADALLARGVRTWAYRDLPMSALARRARAAEAFMPASEQAAWFQRGTSAPVRVRAAVPYDLTGEWPNQPLMRMFTDAAAPLRARKVFVLQPHYYTITAGREVMVPLREHFLRHGWAVWDFMDVVPPTSFRAGSVHLAPEGHDLFAAVLSGLLTPMLDAQP
jgi:hypothetical protein